MQETTPAFKTHGLFSQPPYSNDVYTVIRPDEMFRGKYDNTKPPMYLEGATKWKAATNDGYFQTFHRLFEGESLSNIVALRRSWRRLNNDTKIGKDWIPSSPAKKRCGLGSGSGNFTETYDAMSQEKRVSVKPPSLPNFYTNPGKKGIGYGYLDICINPYPEWKEGASIYGLRGPSIAERTAMHQAKCLGRAVFLNQQASGQLFDPSPYEGVNVLAPGHPAIQKFGNAWSNPAKNIGPTFLPSSPAKTDGGCKDGALSKWPEHSNEPFKEMTKIMLEKYRSPPEDSALKAWIPQPPTAITMPQMSVINKNIDLAINAKTRKKRLTVMPMCKK